MSYDSNSDMLEKEKNVDSEMAFKEVYSYKTFKELVTHMRKQEKYNIKVQNHLESLSTTNHDPDHFRTRYDETILEV